MASRFVEINEYHVTHAAKFDFLSEWRKYARGTTSCAYEQIDGNSVVTVTALSPQMTIEELQGNNADAWAALGSHLEGDIRREVLELVEEVKPQRAPVPARTFLQLRYVEVKPPMYSAYRSWRDRTIFDVVRTADEVAEFAAYHTVTSTRPGVVFLSSFDVDPVEYQKVFNSERYRKIVQEAGDNYITGGNQGLATRIFKRLS